MLKIVSVEQMRQIEAAADSSGLTYDMMMQNAGRAAARRALALLNGHSDARVTVLVGKGNNGGDGLVAARVIAEESDALVRCYLLSKRTDDPLLEAAQQAGVHIADAEDDQGFRVLRQMVGSAHLILDALFGIGIRLPLRGEAARLLQYVRNTINEVRALRPDTEIIEPSNPAYHTDSLIVPYVLAVDCPSGLDCDTGEVDHNILPADETITFIAAKPGLLAFPGAGYVGRLTVATIGVRADLPELRSANSVLADAGLIQTMLPARQVNSHKGTYGKALILAGSANYRGAVGLCAQAAYRVGAGLVTVNAPENVITSMAGHILEATWLPRTEADAVTPGDCDALLVGPGWGQSEANRALLRHLLAQELPALVIDADGLNLLAEIPNWWEQLPPNTIITPHPGEMARLSGLSTGEIQSNRVRIAREKAAEWSVILLLKGAHTLIASPVGDLTTLPFKTDALAKAGTGDVLAGIIVGLLAQGVAPYEAAIAGGYVHGLAGELAAQRVSTSRSVLASDVSAHLAEALMRIERRVFVAG
ncbi:MAG TPA: NAD(P)H-hydrate dehydratase [Spirillospora sp.]|nr:NAD(P)H-hydrate dehydratase [Spirillospora sp.]